MKSRYFIKSFAICAFTLVSTSANAVEIQVPYAFIDRFPEIAKNLGFEPGTRLSIGALVLPGDSPIASVMIKNLDTGETLTATSAESMSNIFAEGKKRPILWDVTPMPAFDAAKHTGVWEVTVKDEKGNEAIAKTHNIDKVAEMPFLEGFSATGNPLSPTITWSAPSEKDIPAGCDTEYRVRLLKHSDTQLHRSKALKEMKYAVPEGILKNDDMPDTYVRVEFTCADQDDKDYAAPVETRSETFVPLKALVSGSN